MRLLLSLVLLFSHYANAGAWEDNNIPNNVMNQLTEVGANSSANWTGDMDFVSLTVSEDILKVDQVLDDGWSHYVYIIAFNRFLSKDFKTINASLVHKKIKSIGEQIEKILIEHPNAVFGISLKPGMETFYKMPDGMSQTYWHLAFENDKEVRETYQKLWKIISEDLNHISSNNLVFNILNEPEFEQMRAWNKRELWQEWSTEIVDEIRNVSPGRTIIIEAIHKGLWARHGNPANILLPIDRTNIVYGFHYYYHEELKVMHWSSEVKSHMSQLINYSNKYNVPVVLSEIGLNGLCDGIGPAPSSRAAYAGQVYGQLIPADIGITWWSIDSPSNSPYQRVNGDCDRNLDKELIKDEELFLALNLN